MSRKSASLLTKTQRRRIREDFAGLEEAKVRRDQQRIRERLESGILDFELLADYPDRQFELAFDDHSDEEVREALVDAYVVVERLRELDGYDRDELVADARTRVNELLDAEDVRTLDGLELETASEIRRQTRDDLTERYGVRRWVRWANRMMGVTAAATATSALLWLSDRVLGTRLWMGNETSTIEVLIWGLIFAGVAGWMLVMGVGVLRHEVVPALVEFTRRPRETTRSVWERWVPERVRTVVSERAARAEQE